MEEGLRQPTGFGLPRTRKSSPTGNEGRGDATPCRSLLLAATSLPSHTYQARGTERLFNQVRSS